MTNRQSRLVQRLPGLFAGAYFVGSLAFFAALWMWAAGGRDRSGATPFPLLVWQVGWYGLSYPTVFVLEKVGAFKGPISAWLGTGLLLVVGSIQWGLVGFAVKWSFRRLGGRGTSAAATEQQIPR